MHQQYQANRSRFPITELAKYHGQWVAFSMEEGRVIASSKDLSTLDVMVVAAGEDPEQVAFERIDLDERHLGGAELS
jgi:hypothetical protein